MVECRIPVSMLGVQVTAELGFFLHSSHLIDSEDSDSLILHSAKFCNSRAQNKYLKLVGHLLEIVTLLQIVNVQYTKLDFVRLYTEMGQKIPWDKSLFSVLNSSVDTVPVEFNIMILLTYRSCCYSCDQQ